MEQVGKAPAKITGPIHTKARVFGIVGKTTVQDACRNFHSY